MTEAEIRRLWEKLYPWARPKYAKEFAALRAGTSLGELARKRKREVGERAGKRLTTQQRRSA